MRAQIALEAHDLTDEFRAEISAQGITVIDRTREPYTVVFEGELNALKIMVNKHWFIDRADWINDELDDQNAPIYEKPNQAQCIEMTSKMDLELLNDWYFHNVGYRPSDEVGFIDIEAFRSQVAEMMFYHHHGLDSETQWEE